MSNFKWTPDDPRWDYEKQLEKQLLEKDRLDEEKRAAFIASDKCKTCGGLGELKKYPYDYAERESTSFPRQRFGHVEMVECRACDGSGTISPETKANYMERMGAK